MREVHLKAKNHNMKQSGLYYYLSTQTHFGINREINSAMQMWTLARYLPLVIGDLVPEEDEHWEIFLTLLDILDICLAPKTNEQQASHLTMLIAAHHESFKEAYPHLRLIPKQHYMVHYPEWIRRYACGETVHSNTILVT